jgi:hypothetical protein
MGSHEMTDSVVRIDSGVMDQVREFSEKTGIPSRRVLDDALKHWLDTVAPKLLEAHGKEPLTPRFEMQIGYGHAKRAEPLKTANKTKKG